MLQLKNIKKSYTVGDKTQVALEDIYLNFRENEFVAILGPSGSGKTSLLNIIGGLDHYDEGDLIINEISTKKYKDRDWDSYRNHTVGFIFQNYNLIPHLTILENVELALTISGDSRKNRSLKASKMLEKVGLGSYLHKKPNQLSGGQMQRVSIARALINEPDILLADEPTGALDSETSIQIMDLLKELAKDHLVIMVTHNPELAKEYATRIIQLKDGHIVDDSFPYEIYVENENPVYVNMGKSSMSYLMALSLSFKNLKTKKMRTLLTSFAGSIGIIGIALILSLSNGVTKYIDSIQKDTMTSYPVTIEEQTFDLQSILSTSMLPLTSKKDDVSHKLDAVYSNGEDMELASTVETSISSNSLTDFKNYLEDKYSPFKKWIGENGVIYSYNVAFDIYTYDKDNEFYNTNGNTLIQSDTSIVDTLSGFSSMFEDSMSMYEELLPGQDEELVSPTINKNYELIYGNYPQKKDEILLIVNQNNEISSTTLYKLGFLPSKEYKDYQDKINNGKAVKLDDVVLQYEDICKKEFYLLANCDYYKKEDGNVVKITNLDEIEDLVKEKAMPIKIVGILQQKENIDSTLVSKQIAYTKALSDYIIEYSNQNEIIKEQEENKDVNILNHLHFKAKDDDMKIEDVKEYCSHLGVSDKAKVYLELLKDIYKDDEQTLTQFSIQSEEELSKQLDEYLKNPNKDILLNFYEKLDPGSYDNTLKTLGLISLDAPNTISIYVDSFENKNHIIDCIDDYNAQAKDENKIVYTDYVEILMSSITKIINVISYVLIAFVSVSLIVSSIMIGIITYISVLERTKEIGILRAIGASKNNIYQVFNAETVIIGMFSGVLGVGLNQILLILINHLLKIYFPAMEITASLPIKYAFVLILLSTILTLIGGFSPSKKASKKDPVEALRSE